MDPVTRSLSMATRGAAAAWSCDGAASSESGASVTTLVDAAGSTPSATCSTRSAGGGTLGAGGKSTNQAAITTKLRTAAMSMFFCSSIGGAPWIARVGIAPR